MFCHSCLKDKATDEFYHYKGQLKRPCKECAIKRERIRWQSYKSRGALLNKKWKETHQDKMRQYAKNFRFRRRLAAISHYGGKCVCCGESDQRFLTIDHINGDGNKHRKTIGYSFSIYHWLFSNNYPEGFQILCYNCNCAKSIYKICPHKLTVA